MPKALSKSIFLCCLLALLVGCTKTYRIDHVQLGIWAAERDLWDEAIFRWRKSLAENPNLAAAHNNLAVAYEKKGLWEEARQEYEIALKLSPDNAHVKSNYQNFQRHLDMQDTDESKDKKDEKK